MKQAPLDKPITPDNFSFAALRAVLAQGRILAQQQEQDIKQQVQAAPDKSEKRGAA